MSMWDALMFTMLDELVATTPHGRERCRSVPEEAEPHTVPRRILNGHLLLASPVGRDKSIGWCATAQLTASVDDIRRVGCTSTARLIRASRFRACRLSPEVRQNSSVCAGSGVQRRYPGFVLSSRRAQ